MDAFDVYRIHNQGISNYLVVYVVSITVITISGFLLFRYSSAADTKLIFKGFFFTMFIAGFVLAGSGLSFRSKNIREMREMRIQFEQNSGKFLTERLEAASNYKSHFYRLLVIWCVAIAVLTSLIMLLFQKKLLLGIIFGLAVCALLSLTLDYAGFRSDAQYFEALKRLSFMEGH